ncbi:MAG: GTP-binding protein [Clostridium sp.]|nr:GTP-binding protein [Clostridium sp.]
MSIKLSELKDDEMLLVGENLVISKEDFVKEIKEHKDKEVYTTTEYRARIDARSMLECAIDCEADNMHEDWGYDVWDDITEEDINELQNVIDRILRGHICYITDKKVEIDI